MLRKIEAAFMALLEGLRPLIGIVAIMFGILAAWKCLGDMFPVLARLWMPTGDVIKMATIAGALALCSMARLEGLKL